MSRALVALVLGLTVSPAALAQTGFMPPGGTNAQGATGGITSDGHVMWGPPQVATAPGSFLPVSVPARADQVRRGYVVYSTGGGLIGKVAYADGRVAVVESDRSALRLPVEAFGIKRNGLLLQMTPARFEQLAKAGGVPR